MKDLLNKPIGKKSGNEKYPEKTTINLLVRETGFGDPKRRIAIMVVVVILAAVFLKFLVFDRIWAAYEAEREYTEIKQQIAELQIVNKDYEKIRQEYGHYGNGYMNGEESMEQDRAAMMSVINSEILSKADIQSIQISENLAIVTIDNIKLGTVSSIVAALESQKTVSFVNVSTAGTNSDSGSSVQATLNINFKENGGKK
ncbi:MAG: hypothetical protein GX663_09845 [Clostridiales bacterium]|nr:hypothetical protein [Clostridiales bacterium]